ncbi:MAG: CYTH domain-containing protein [Candidatus Izemoplasmataceae bacterium]
MAKKTRTLDKEMRHQLSKAQCYELMDYLMVHFSDTEDYHYNYYFDTSDGALAKQDITLRQRTIRKGKDFKYVFTLKIPTYEPDTYVEYNQPLSEKEMRRLVYNNVLPEGEIKDLSSIHGGNVKNVNLIRVSRVVATYKDLNVFFDKISHRGKTFYEIGTNIESDDWASSSDKVQEFKELLKKFDIEYKRADRRSRRFR